MIKFVLKSLIGSAMCLMVTYASAADITWNGGTSTDPTDGANWDGGVAPGAADTAFVGSSANIPDLAGASVDWGRLALIFANDIADTGGGGVINLTGGNSQFETHGVHDSTLAPAINATGMVRGNGEHNITFNGSVTAAKIESHGTAVTTFNDVLEFTDSIITVGNSASVVINGELRWNNVSPGINGGGIVAIGPASTLTHWNGASFVLGLDLVNLYDGVTVRADGDNILNADSDLWDRHGNSTFDLNGYDQVLEYIGSTGGLNMNLDFGAAAGANTLVWDASHNMNGTYAVLNFEAGIDTLEFGPYGNNGGFIPVNLAKVSINGAPFAEVNPGNGTSWWEAVLTPDVSDDPLRQIAVYHAVPEPASLALGAIVMLLVGSTRKSRVFR